MFKSKGSKSFIFIFLFVYSSFINAAVDETGAVNAKANTTGSVPLEAGASNWEWVQLGSVSMPKYNGNIGRHCNNRGTALCAWSGMGLHHGRKLGNKSYFEFPYATATAVDDSGKYYSIPMVLAFPGSVYFNLRHYSSHAPAPGYTTMLYALDVPKTYHTGWSVDPIPGWNTDPFPTCHNFGSRCTESIMLFLNSSSVDPVLWVKIPKNLTAKKIKFNSVVLMKIRVLASDAGLDIWSPEANLEVSGEFTLPQRCYIDLSNNQIDFGDVKPNDKNGLIQSKGITIKSTCYNAPSSSRFSIKVSPKNSSLNQDGSRIISAVDQNGQEAIGLIFSINKNLDCNNSDKFNSVYLVRNGISGDKQEIFHDTINIGLCKYGIPAKFGTQSATINITAKWADLYT